MVRQSDELWQHGKPAYASCRGVLGRAGQPLLVRASRLRRLGRSLSDERGAVLILTVMMMPVMFGFLGLMLDGSMLYAARRELQDAADSAALAGAMQVDLGYFARKGRWRIAFDMNLPGARTADEAVQEVCARYGVTCESSVPWYYRRRLIKVTARTEFRTLFIQLLTGQRQYEITAKSKAIMVPAY